MTLVAHLTTPTPAATVAAQVETLLACFDPDADVTVQQESEA